MRLSTAVGRQARELIASRLGLDFLERRQEDLERGLLQACRASSVPTPEAYLHWLETLSGESPEWRRLVSHLTVGETYFFRDRATLEALEQHVLPSLIAARRAERTLRLRLWSAGCATGEEPHSLAILLDRLLPDRSDWALVILATDINAEALAVAMRGRYREWSFRETPSWIRERFFRRTGAQSFELEQRIRRMVTFAPLNLAEESYPAMVTNTSAMDLILCRNVLMYFTREAQSAVVTRLQRALVPNGWLVVSPAEASADLLRPLVPVNFPGAILYRKEEQSRESGQRSAVSGQLSGFSSPPEADGWWRVADSQAPGGQGPEIGGQETGIGGQGRNLETRPPSVEADQPSAVSRPPEVDGGWRMADGEAPSDLQRARTLADQGDLEEARRLCEAALAQDRLNAEAHLLLAAICQERGETAAAQKALQKAIYLAPDSAPAHFLLGSLLLQQRERKRGLRSMETVVTLLNAVPRDKAVLGSDGLTAGRLLETARMNLELGGQHSAISRQQKAESQRLKADR